MKDESSNLESKHEAAIAALLATRTVREAAKRCKVSETTLYRLLSLPEFKTKYREARRNLVENTIAQLQQDGTDAVTALREIVKNKKAPASVRVSAAKVILEQSIKGVEQLDTLERIEALEQMMKTKGKRA